MSDELADLVPRWNPSPSPETTRPRGLSDELAEEGVLNKDFVMPDATYRVRTRIGSELSTWSFCSAVSRDGVEFDRSPWHPILQDLAAGGDDSGAREQLVRAALEAHLELCARVGRALERNGRLRIKRALGRPLLLTAAVLLVTVASALGWYYWPERPAPPPAEKEVSEPATPDTTPPPFSPNELAVGPKIEPDPARPSLDTAKPRTTEPPPTRPPERRAPAPSPRQISGGPPEPQPTTSPQELEEPTAVPVAEQEAGGETAAPVPEPLPSAKLWPVTAVSPSAYSTFRLLPGDLAYSPEGVRLVEIPVAFRGLRCLTTRSGRGDTTESIQVNLTEPARVYIAHDRKVKKRPSWLAPFNSTGDSLVVVEVDKGRKTQTYLLFWKDFPAGVLTLGVNNEATALGKTARRIAGRSSRMYLVCIAGNEGRSRLVSGEEP